LAFLAAAAPASAQTKDWYGNWKRRQITIPGGTAAGTVIRLRISGATASTIYGELPATNMTDRMNSVRITRRDSSGVWTDLTRNLFILSSANIKINFALPAGHVDGDQYWLYDGATPLNTASQAN
jgi:hypothetical protein